ncbi:MULTISPECIES: hypothetical protein [Acinetobacter]|uniref:hypothetical protein n=1 Tax=Acinetobacter TaxID=469 RepID=UPI0004D79CAE|nr:MULTISPECIES: hypothetical protein [unclassified Acinetobacter]KEC82671.1 hypothetical protein DT74_21500 [Acinetobacter sp. ETR1]WEE38105.1 hypothetical protein PYV58_14260 [Acinetobacter sp. TAC-1]
MTSYFYLFLSILLLSCYLSFHHRGVNDFSKSLKKAQLQASLLSVQLYPPITLINGIGILNENNKEIYVYNLACGNYKCAGINVTNFQLKTYLPENYSILIPEKHIKE